MIKFKIGNYLDETKMTSHEAKEFVAFLKSEIRRHEEHMEQYRLIAESENTSTLMRITAQTVVIRNLADIRHTQRTIDYLNKKCASEMFTGGVSE